ncbi:hypothetical protein K474DRAFT_1662502 [Panus rudis PR-1116 ss-1]|nr:hypothetical protein K474DRAFT_1662502 [Panus rudis PR-1116 ss-1]
MDDYLVETGDILSRISFTGYRRNSTSHHVSSPTALNTENGHFYCTPSTIEVDGVSSSSTAVFARLPAGCPESLLAPNTPFARLNEDRCNSSIRIRPSTYVYFCRPQH